MDLVILAAGIGSRFGGNKQIEPVGPNGEILLEYSVYDAIIAGFKKVIFVIRKDDFDFFKSLEINKYIDVQYAFQSNDNVPSNKNREKPLGTAHALLCAKDFIDDKFMIINADDFYGRDSFKLGFDYLKKSKDYGLIGYDVKNTLSINGKVKRGICEVENGYLKKINESFVWEEEGQIFYTKEGTNDVFPLKDALVSMNMILFDKSIFDYIERQFKVFLESDELEFYIPNVLYKSICEGKRCKVIKTSSVWYGMTYREDLNKVKESINHLIDNRVYPKNLWK